MCVLADVDAMLGQYSSEVWTVSRHDILSTQEVCVPAAEEKKNKKKSTCVTCKSNVLVLDHVINFTSTFITYLVSDVMVFLFFLENFGSKLCKAGLTLER